MLSSSSSLLRWNNYSYFSINLTYSELHLLQLDLYFFLLLYLQIPYYPVFLVLCILFYIHCLDGITIVISPLISLMKDQVDALNTMGIKASLINSSLSNSEYSKVLEEIENDECIYR